MPLTITIDASGVISRLDAMEAKLKDFPNQMGVELTTWQTEDMHRHYPNTEVTENYAETDIWPTSRTAQQADAKKAKKIVRAHKTQSAPTIVRAKGAPTARPILRSELYEKLVERMSLLLNRCLSWR